MINKSYIVIAYYTKNSLYETKIDVLRRSMERLQIPYDIHAIESLGNWYKNTQIKPSIILQKLNEHTNKNIVYVDADAEFFSYPNLFDQIPEEYNVAAYELDHTQFRRKNVGKELLSGTLFFRNNNASQMIIKQWIKYCHVHSKIWDQAALKQAIGDSFFKLPPQYCCIFDYMKDISNPVIKHYQASRQQKFIERKKGLI